MKRDHLILKIFFGLLLVSNSSVFAAETAAQYVHLGNVSGKAGKYKEAILEYTKAVEEEPNDTSAYYNRGYAYIEIRKYKLAIADLDKAVEINPKYAPAYHVRGIAYFSRKKYAQAIVEYNKAIALDPDNKRYYTSRMSAHFKLGDNDGAWEDVMKIQQLGGTVNPAIVNMLKNRKYREQ